MLLVKFDFTCWNRNCNAIKAIRTNQNVMRQKLLLTLLLVYVHLLLDAQSISTIKGAVKDGDGKPFQNASISIKGTNKGTVTDASGNFSIATSVGETLVFSSVGYQSV